MNTSLSLRARLTAVILTPLIVVAILAGTWAYLDAQRNAADRFDRSLLFTALAISRDIAVTGGDALSQETRDILRDTSGAEAFYHVYAPDGVFVTGYATPPVPPDLISEEMTQYYDAEYMSEDVRALRLTQQASVDGLTGLYRFTVWQSTRVRDGFLRTRTTPVFGIIATLIGAVVVIVWFGVRRGLAPLRSLEHAIARRSIDDLSPIRRSIPPEVSGIVACFNDLLGDLSHSIEAKDAFISDAAHQLRNPIAGVIALTDAVTTAKDLPTARHRAEDLRSAVTEIGHLTNSLLTLERLKGEATAQTGRAFDARALLTSVAGRMTAELAGTAVQFTVDLPRNPCPMTGDPVMVEQAILNILNNAVLHGGPDLSHLKLAAFREDDVLRVTVTDDGKGIAPENFERALGRFSQVGPSAGSGLGLPIAAAVARNHGGTIALSKTDRLFCVEVTFALSGSDKAG